MAVEKKISKKTKVIVEVVNRQTTKNCLEL